MDKKDPLLKLRYARGLGDFVSCLLHSKYFKNVTKFFTGKEEPCEQCNIRKNALNILFPIPFWKIYFENETQRDLSFEKELLKFGYQIYQNEEENKCSCSSTLENEFDSEENIFTEKEINNKGTLISESTNTVGDLIIEIRIYKNNEYND